MRLELFYYYYQSHVYLVEKVLKHDKQGKRLFVKWVGFDSRHNKWIPEENILLDN